MSLELQSQVSAIADAIIEIWEEVKQTFIRIVRALSDGIHHMLKKLHPRLYYLAYHGPTARIRKKNMRRLWTYAALHIHILR